MAPVGLSQGTTLMSLRVASCYQRTPLQNMEQQESSINAVLNEEEYLNN